MKNDLISLITNKQAHIGVIGLGYVGLPLLVEFTSRGFHGTGFEVDEAKAQQINAGASYIGDVSSRKVKEVVDAGRLRATTDFSHLSECDAIIICVPTPLRKTKEPDVSYILAAAEEITQRADHALHQAVVASTACSASSGSGCCCVDGYQLSTNGTRSPSATVKSAMVRKP